MESVITRQLLKKTAVCAAMGISPRTLENLVNINQFPPGERVGKWCFWSPKVLEDWRLGTFSAQEAWRPI